MERAREINDDANFVYSAANAPLMIRAGLVVTQQMFQFQKYFTQKELEDSLAEWQKGLRLDAWDVRIGIYRERDFDKLIWPP